MSLIYIGGEKMFVAYKNDILFPEYVDDTVADTPAECYYWLTGKELPEDKFASDALLEEFGTETKCGETYQIYDIIQIERLNIFCKTCKAHIMQSYTLTEFHIFNPRERFMGSVYTFTLNDAFEKVKLLKAGHCPICERWHTGSDNNIYCDRRGFGYQKGFFDEETMERLDDLCYIVEKRPRKPSGPN